MPEKSNMIDERCVQKEFRFRCDACGWQAPWQKTRQDAVVFGSDHIGNCPRGHAG